MEIRSANVIFGKAGGNASKNSYTCKISLPKTWVDRMGLNTEHREVQLTFDGDRITIGRHEYSPIKQVPLVNNKRIHVFALVWEQIYRNHKTIPGAFFENIEFMGEGLADLGFVMDCGESLERMFPATNASSDNAALQQIIEQLDIQTLGNAIYSQWRYWNHWSNAPMEDKDFEWFVIALSRLAELTEEHMIEERNENNADKIY